MEENNNQELDLYNLNINAIELDEKTLKSLEKFSNNPVIANEQLEYYYVYGIPDPTRPGARYFPNDAEFIRIMKAEPYNFKPSEKTLKHKIKTLRYKREEVQAHIADKLTTQIAKTNAAEYARAFSEIAATTIKAIQMSRKLLDEIETDELQTTKEKTSNLNKNVNTIRQAAETIYLLSGEKQNHKINGNNNNIIKNPTVNILVQEVEKEKIDIDENNIIIIEQENQEE